jgi:RNA polymerase sigma factor (sigma-70 family)
MDPAEAARALFLEQLPTIDRIAAALCRRRGLHRDEAEDFGASVRARFVELDYAPLRSFRGEASLTTYLSVVIASWLKDYLVARDGRWRPSATAMRLGPVAVHLERLIVKRGASRVEAVAEVLNGADQPFSERELQAIIRQLPMRQPMRAISVAEEDAAPIRTAESMQADATVVAAEQAADASRAEEALTVALSELAAEERLLVSMRFLDGNSIADIARSMRVDQKPLYRQLDRALQKLRVRLESSGISGADVRLLTTEVDS